MILVDGVPHFAQAGAQLALALGADFGARQRHRHGGEYQHDGEGHDQLDQRQPSLVLAGWGGRFRLPTGFFEAPLRRFVRTLLHTT